MSPRSKTTPPLQLALDVGNPNGAIFSECGRFRYLLWRAWNPALPVLTMVMLNPSIAGAERNDNTVSVCMQRARDLGCGGLRVVNLFSLVSTQPAGLLTVDDPIGPLNDAYLVDACLDAKMVICAWGASGSLLGRDRIVTALLRGAGIALHAIHINQDGSPAHPLRQPYSRIPQPFNG